MEGLAVAQEHKGLDDLSASDGATKATTNKPWSSWERISSAWPILKNEGAREEEEGGGNGKRKSKADECVLSLKSLTKLGCCSVQLTFNTTVTWVFFHYTPFSAAVNLLLRKNLRPRSVQLHNYRDCQSDRPPLPSLSAQTRGVGLFRRQTQ